MRSFKFFWTTHKWTGICLAAVFACSSVTGFMLLIKKKVAWIQPPTQEGANGTPEQFLSLQDMFERVLDRNHPDFQSWSDVDRVDFRPGDRMFKVRSEHNHSEIQVDAITGEVTSDSWRPSDLFESIHDGSFFGAWAHDWVMPAASIGLLFMTFSGFWLWLEPKVRKHRRKNRTIRRASIES